jgi:hypothetical protein
LYLKYQTFKTAQIFFHLINYHPFLIILLSLETRVRYLQPNSLHSSLKSETKRAFIVVVMCNGFHFAKQRQRKLQKQAGVKFSDNKGVITYSRHPFMSPLWLRFMARDEIVELYVLFHGANSII